MLAQPTERFPERFPNAALRRLLPRCPALGAAKETLLKDCRRERHNSRASMTPGRMTMKQWLSRNATMSAAVVILLVTVLAGTAWALSNITLKLGTVASCDCGGFSPGYPVPAKIQVHAFTMDPGDVVPWHYHKGTS